MPKQASEFVSAVRFPWSSFPSKVSPWYKSRSGNEIGRPTSDSSWSGRVCSWSRLAASACGAGCKLQWDLLLPPYFFQNFELSGPVEHAPADGPRSLSNFSSSLLLSSEQGTYKTVKAGFWSWRPGRNMYRFQVVPSSPERGIRVVSVLGI